jgi:hypothetical protein
MFYGHLEYFMTIWYILVSRKIWQPCRQRCEEEVDLGSILQSHVSAEKFPDKFWPKKLQIKFW